MSDVHRKDVELFRGLEPVLGSDVAVLLLERLPPPAEDLATKADLEPFAKRVDVETHTAEMSAHFHETITSAFHAQNRRLLVGLFVMLAPYSLLIATYITLVT